MSGRLPEDKYRQVLNSPDSQNRISDMEQISGQQIKEARERKRWTQQELADELGVSMRTVGSWERGESIPRNRYGAIVDLLDLDKPDKGREYGRKAMARRLGTLAKQRREELGLGQRTLAIQADIGSDRTIKDFEFGERSVSPLTARRIEKALGWKNGIVDTLLRESESRRASTVQMEELDAFDSSGDSSDQHREWFLKSLTTAELLEELQARLGRLEWEEKWKSANQPPAPDSQDLYGMAANSDPSHLERLTEDEG